MPVFGEIKVSLNDRGFKKKFGYHFYKRKKIVLEFVGHCSSFPKKLVL